MRPWSFSRLATQEECPAQYKYSYIDRLPSSRPKSPAAERGIQIHEKADQYLKGLLPMYPPALQKVAGHAMLLKRLNAMGEQKYAVSENWEPLDFNEVNAMLRGILDVVHVSEDKTCVGIEDWKSGQPYPDHQTQLETYVPLVAPFFPEAKEFKTRLIYLDQGVVTPVRTVSRERAEGMRIMVDARIKNAEAETIYPVKPGQHCRFCNYSKRFGGPCSH